MKPTRTRAANDAAAYLASTDILDHEHDQVRAVAASLRGVDTNDTARRCFEFVRDQIEHSADFRRSPTTLRASDVLAARTGFCYAKSHLLVALLRANAIPAGLCYQRLTVSGPTPPFCLHGYVAIELPGIGDFAVDPRGNKPGVDARFDPPHERLAFAITNDGERDFPLIFDRPLDVVVRCLRDHATFQDVLANLPDAEALAIVPSRREVVGRR